MVSPTESILRQGQERSEFRDFDPKVMAAVIQRSIDGLPLLMASDVDLDLDAYAREVVTLFELARRMGFDASHVTALIDRLEERGFIERRPDPADRRVKRITVTEEGVAIQDEIRRRVCEGLPPLVRLSAAERIQLRDLLAAATGRAVGGDRERQLAAKG